MLIKVGDVIDFLEEQVPSKYACKWDNVGLLVGSREYSVTKIMVAIDATNDVVMQAIKAQVDMIITHHPIIFSEMKKVTDGDFIGNKIIRLLENKIAVFSMHTNFDACKLTDKVCEILEITGDILEVVDEENAIGIGKVGNINTTSLRDYTNFVKDKLEVDYVKVFGDIEKPISRVAISQGAGGSMIKFALKEKADLLVTGDIDHHEGIDAIQQGLAIIDAGHYETEKYSLGMIEEMMKQRFKEHVEVIIADQQAPYVVV